MSASSTSPHSARPGVSRCAGLGRQNVTVTRAGAAVPDTAPLSPSTPDGTSTATTGTPGAPGDARRGDRFQHRRRRALDGAGEAGAEQRVDDKSSVGDGRRVEPAHGPAPARGHDRGVAAQGGAVAEQRDRHRPAGVGEERGDAETVSAIVAGGRSRTSVGRGGPAPPDDTRDRGGGVLHQGDAGSPRGDRRGVGAGHARRRQNFETAPVHRRPSP